MPDGDRVDGGRHTRACRRRDFATDTVTYYSDVFSRAEDETGDPAAAFRREIVAKHNAGAQTQAECYGADSEAAAQATIDANARAARAAGRAVVMTGWRF
jgi:hypothetical protein